VGFRLNDYDRAKPLVIDPTIVYASLIGGGTSSTYSYGIALDSSGNAYIAGYTYASDFPTANAAYSQAHSLPDGFVSKIDPPVDAAVLPPISAAQVTIICDRSPWIRRERRG